MKRTQWFHADEQQPMRIGFYEVRCSCGYVKGTGRLKWNGTEWLWPDREKSTFGAPCDKWRGLMEKSK